MPKGTLLVDTVSIIRAGERFKLTLRSGDAVGDFSISHGDLVQFTEESWLALEEFDASVGKNVLELLLASKAHPRARKPGNSKTPSTPA